MHFLKRSTARGLALFLLALSLSGGVRADDPKEPDASLHEGAPPASFDNLTGDWWGVRRKLAEKGITFDIDYMSDFTKNLRGGVDTEGSTWRRMFEATMTLDTKPLLGIEGGIVFVDFQNATGPNASDDLTGDVQGLDGLDGVPGQPHQNRTQIAQLWYQQIAFDGVLRIKAGKVDANNEFDHCNAAQEFLNQSTGSSATLFTLPTYPDPATSLNIFVKPTKDLQIGFGLYDGSYANGVRTGSTGPRTFFRSAEDLFLIGEVDQSWKVRGLAGRLAVGGWYSTNRFARLDGSTATGTGGPYALLEQTIWREDTKNVEDAREIDLLLMYGYADPSILTYDHNIGGGISWTGPLPSRVHDILGAGVQAIHFSNGYEARREFEVSYEIFYRVQLKPWLAIKPDVQYITGPSGKGNGDALAVTVRVEVHF